jgi:alanine dehydrogenase
MALALGAEEVREALDIAGAIEAMEELCRDEAAGQTLSSDRIHIRLPRGFLRILPGVLTRTGVLGYKEFHSGRDGMRYSIHLFDFETGEPLAMMDANYVTAIRTGAMAGVALKYLTDESVTRAGIIGSGAEARSEVAALMAVRPGIHQGRVFSPNADHREAFAREIATTYGIDMVAVDRPERAIEHAEVLLTATGGRGEVAVQGAWLHAGLHVNSIGSTSPEQREIDPVVWQRADAIVLDTRRLLHESGDALVAKENNALDERKVVELHQVVSGAAPGRVNAEQITLYKSVGTGLQDVAAAFRIYHAAKAQGLGTQVPDFVTPRGLARPAAPTLHRASGPAFEQGPSTPT